MADIQTHTPPLKPRPAPCVGDPAAATDEQLLEVIYLQQRDSGDASPELREFLYRHLGRIL